ncbi:MAG: alpha/beta hydrolase [Acidobacteriota bacterium]|nr:alpha/beta hydrolase [Acidobacteriota bacterium]
MPDPAPERLSSLEIPGPAGPLEALLRVPAAPRGAALVAHPHPMHGGTMHTKVVHRAARLLAQRFSLETLRINFRGVGASAGVYDGGVGETEDVVAAAGWLRARRREGTFVLSGFSFGSLCALRAAARVSPEILFLIGVPVDRWDAAGDVSPASHVVWIQGGSDEFSAQERAGEIAAARGWTFLVVPGADHFFTGRLEEFESAAGDALAQLIQT